MLDTAGSAGALILTTRPHRLRHTLVHTAQGAFWTSLPEAFGKSRYLDRGGEFRPETGVKARLADAEPYARDLADNPPEFDPSVIQHSVDALNAGEWQNIDKYFEGLNPLQLERQRYDPHFVILGSMLQQGRHSDLGWRWPHEIDAEAPGILSPRSLRQLPHEQLAGMVARSGGYQNSLAGYMKGYADLIGEHYNDRVENMWADDPDYNTLIHRLSAIPGISDYKKAPMIADILRRTLQVTGKNWPQEHLQPVIDDHAARLYSRMMTDDPLKQKWLLRNSIGGGLKAVPLMTAFTRAITRDPLMAHAPFWHIASRYCGVDNPHCEDCPLGGACASGRKRLGALTVRGWSDDQIPQDAPEYPNAKFSPITPQDRPFTGKAYLPRTKQPKQPQKGQTDVLAAAAD